MGLENRTPVSQSEVSIQMGWRPGKGRGLGRERLEFSGIMRSGSVSLTVSQILFPVSTHHYLRATPLSFLSHTQPFLCIPALFSLSKGCGSFLSSSEGLSFSSLDWQGQGYSIWPSSPSAGSPSEQTASALSHAIQHPEKAQFLPL